MQLIDEILPDTNPQYQKIEEYYDPQEVLMFDIETTGLSASSSFIYLIGVNLKKEGCWHIIQLFNDDGMSEPEIISTFMDILKDYKYLVEFNGDSFDIPFVRKRLEYINRKQGTDIIDRFDDITKIDLYKLIRPYKKALGLANLKQKTIERFLGINRIDQMNGGELINVYFQYLTYKNKKYRSLLLQHNRDDMEGMFFLTDIFALNRLSLGCLKFSDMKIVGGNSLRLKLFFTPDSFPEMSFASTLNNNSLSINKNEAVSPLLVVSGNIKEAYISLPISTGVFKYFYKDTKNYHFYPELDSAYHKDLAASLSEYEKVSANKSNCYTKLEGYFIRKYGFDSGKSFYPADTESPARSDAYIELSDEFLSDSSLVNEFTRYIVKHILAGK